MNNNRTLPGHLCALLTITIWGTTFISTKVLLTDFLPVEILFFRFCIGLLALFLVYPKRLKNTGLKQELLFAAAGLCGVTLYFLMENIALTYTMASNVGVIISISPFFTGLLAYRFLNGEKPRLPFFVGFIASILGIFLISFNGSMVLKLNPKGDLLAVLAAVCWSFYSIMTRKISQNGYHTIQATRRIFTYGIIFMIPALIFFPFRLGPERFSNPVSLLNILYLGLGASAICFVTWNIAVGRLGAVRTSIYIYMVPVVTVVTSAIILREPVTLIAAIGTLLILAGLFISEYKPRSSTVKNLENKI